MLGRIVGRAWREAEPVLQGPGWRALQLRHFAKRVIPRGPHVWLKMDREKWQKDLQLDAVWDKEKELIYLIAMKDILADQPKMRMSLKVLTTYKRYIGLSGRNIRPAAWLQQHPAMFLVDEDMPFLEYLPAAAKAFFQFTPRAAEHVASEKQFRHDNEKLLVDKVRKVLMMTPERRIPLEVFGHLRKDIGMTEDFRFRLMKYPEYFGMEETAKGSELRLTEWDPELAVSSFETLHLAGNGIPEDGDPQPQGGANWSTFRHRANLKKTHMRELMKFHEAPYVSPYQETPLDVKENSLEAEKHAVAVLHELLSLTLRKRLNLARLAQYRTMFMCTKGTRSVIMQHPELFYISLKNGRETVFLRQAYSNSELVMKDPFLEAQSWVAVLLKESKDAIREEKDRVIAERRKAKLEREEAKANASAAMAQRGDEPEEVESEWDFSDVEDVEVQTIIKDPRTLPASGA